MRGAAALRKVLANNQSGVDTETIKGYKKVQLFFFLFLKELFSRLLKERRETETGVFF